jgi:hypothetical protein
MCEDVEQEGGGTVCDGGGIDTSSVVDVPKERMASPGDDSVTIVDGLSPVNGAIMQSRRYGYPLLEWHFEMHVFVHILGEKLYRSIHHFPTYPMIVPPDTGSPASLLLRSGPPHVSNRPSSHRKVLRDIKFIPLASEHSIGAMRHRKRVARKEETSDM